MADPAPGEIIDSTAPRTGSYFVSTYPPFSCWTGGGAESFGQTLEGRPEPPTTTPLGLYIHIPFCVERCSFCYYLSYDDGREEISAYLDCVVSELERYARSPYLEGRQLSFIYFGGGTPSILSRERIRQLMGGLQSILPWDAVREVTFECAPASVRRDKLQQLRDAGVNRISLGVQQLNDDVLTANGRIHMVHDVERAIADIKQVGFDVLNLDLIVGLTGETDRTFFGSLERVLELGPESITIYQLEIPHNTPLYRSVRDGETPSDPPDWAETRRRLRRAYARVAEAGYSWRSAYTAVRDSERHAFVYQDALYAGAELIGVGASSFGYLDGVHQQNVASLGRYVEAISTDRLPLWRGHRLTRAERMVREFVLQLKLGRVDLASFDRRFGHAMTRHFDEPLKQFEEQRLVETDNRRVALSADGLARVDHMIPAFYLPEHRSIRYS